MYVVLLMSIYKIGFSLKSLKMRVPGTHLCGVKGSFNQI